MTDQLGNGLLTQDDLIIQDRITRKYHKQIVKRLKKRMVKYKITDTRFDIIIYKELEKILGEKP